jgi:dsDNA-specific endonuclease/ATPase MutS2
MGIAVAILEELRKSGSNFLVTTHYPEVKEYAEKTDHIVNARMTFDKETLMPTYRMVIGEAGESCAFYIADRLGMPKDMLTTAVEAAYGNEAAKSYDFLKDIEENVIRVEKIYKEEEQQKAVDKEIIFTIKMKKRMIYMIESHES